MLPGGLSSALQPTVTTFVNFHGALFSDIKPGLIGSNYIFSGTSNRAAFCITNFESFLFT